MVKWVSFDVWGTLINANPNYRPQRNKLIAEILFPEVFNTPTVLLSDMDVVDGMVKKAKDFCDYSNEALGEQMSWRQALLNTIMNYSHMIDKSKIAERMAFFDNENKKLIFKHLPYPIDNVYGVLEMLRDKKVGANVACNTGFTDGVTMMAILEELKLNKFFHFSVYSDMVMASKPSEKFFNHVIIGALANRKDILHVGDNAFADGGSIKVGIPFLQVNGNSGNTILETLKYV